MPNIPFRLIAFTGGAPYPLHETQPTAEQSRMFDLVSGDRFQNTDSIRQPIAEDFLRPQRPLPAPRVKVYEAVQYFNIIEPIEEHPEDQILPDIEPDSYFVDPSRPNPSRRDTIATAQPSDFLEVVPDPKRSKSAADVYESAGFEQSQTPAICDDMFSPAPGGLHKLPTAPPRKLSRMGRIKRFFSLKHRREYGRASR
jgi:hypothetical protein